MYAITMQNFGAPDVLEWTTAPSPALGHGEVRIDVVATAVNRADLMQRQGFYPPPPGASDILGLECSGYVAEVGDGVTGWQTGDRVCALLSGGGYAEEVVVPATQLLPVPNSLDLHAAAALPEVACTVWSNLVLTAGMHSGQLLLLHGGASGIGTHAIQVAVNRGVTVAVTAGSRRKLDMCRELGASVLIDYKNDDFVDAVRNVDGHEGADIILDNMGAKYLGRNVDALAPDGQLVIIGMQGGVTGDLEIGKLMSKRGTVHAAGLRGRPETGRSSKADIVAAVTKDLWPLVTEGVVQPIVHAELPITDAAEAHRLLDSPDVIGKVVLRVR